MVCCSGHGSKIPLIACVARSRRLDPSQGRNSNGAKEETHHYIDIHGLNFMGKP